MITFIKNEKHIVLQYEPERSENWIPDAIEKRKKIELKKTFTLWSELYIPNETSQEEFYDIDEFDRSSFYFAFLLGEYYKIIRGVLVDNFDIYVYKDIIIHQEYFVTHPNTSVFKVIGNIYKGDLYIGGNHPNSIEVEIFENFLKYFPTHYEIKKYVEARVASLFRNYFDNVKDAQFSYQKYVDKKLTTKGNNLLKTFKDAELIKFLSIQEKLEEMLKNELNYSEKNWQEEILQIILLLYPKYLYVFREVLIQAKPEEGIKEKYLDFLLVDSNGNCDILEIKKPFENAIMTKGFYRDNYIPLRELSGTVMQIEKYIYYLNRWSYQGEKQLTYKYKSSLPDGFDIKITNPSGIIIMGRENNLSTEQKRDFEVVKRKYKNVMDIITYDSLLHRLKATIEQIKKT